MELLIALAALLSLIVVVLVLKRRSSKAKQAKSNPATAPVSKVEVPKPATVEPKVEAPKPVTVEPKDGAPSGGISSIERSVVLNKVEEPAKVEPQAAKTQAPTSVVSREEKIPEDSALRRHYLAARRAEKEAIANPYPTDSMLRRHRESLLASLLNQGLSPKTVVGAEAPLKTPTNLASVPGVPEDSTLRRHYLTQVQAEMESQYSPRPTDSALRRHYDSLIKAKMEAYSKAA